MSFCVFVHFKLNKLSYNFQIVCFCFICFSTFVFIRKAFTEIYPHYKMDAIVISKLVVILKCVCIRVGICVCIQVCNVVGGGAVSVLLFYK